MLGLEGVLLSVLGFVLLAGSLTIEEARAQEGQDTF